MAKVQSIYNLDSETEDMLFSIASKEKIFEDYEPTTRQRLWSHCEMFNKKLRLIEELNRKRVKKFDVFVTELCDGNLSKKGTNFTLTQSIDICKQLLEGLEQLEKSEKSHNDLKPENILYKTGVEKYSNGDQKISIKIADFGTADRSGGTPGWTWPCFISQRKPGRSDMYSVALLILYLMCDSRHLFYRLRDNYVEGRPSWKNLEPIH